MTLPPRHHGARPGWRCSVNIALRRYTASPVMSISESTLSVAICDQYAFYPFRALVEGGISSWEALDRAELFVRTVLLHDYVEIDAEPMPAPGEEAEWTEEQNALGRRNVIVSFLPLLTRYEDVVHLQAGPARELNLDLPPQLTSHAISAAGSDRVDGPYLKAHLRYLQNLCLVVQRGGSVLVSGKVGQAIVRTSQELPTALLRHLDADIRQFAKQANRGDLGLVVPPFLALLLRRAGRRDRIVDALVELREEWSEPRRRVWETLHALRRTASLSEAGRLTRELKSISRAIRLPGFAGCRPIKVAWQVATEAGAGAVAAWIASGNPLLGAAVPAACRAIAVKGSLGRRLFGLGGFGLARSITREVRNYEPTVDQLRGFLADSEKERLGL